MGLEYLVKQALAWMPLSITARRHAPEWGSLRAGAALLNALLKLFPAGTVLDWHPAPRRQLVVILRGRLEVETSDGARREFGPGDARLIEDTRGRGHVTRILGEEAALLAVVHLGDSPPG
jgi:quercetin dioxygenase-like cupin family protein